MIMAIDVDYRNSTAVTAGVLFSEWHSHTPEKEYTSIDENIAPYETGKFYKRELPCILELIKKHELKMQCIIVDGFVYLDDDLQPGLGKHLFDALNRTVLVVGVAKTPLPTTSDDSRIFRGKSKNPLYVTTTGDLNVAKSNIISMHGDFRLPTLLKRADYLCRI